MFLFDTNIFQIKNLCPSYVMRYRDIRFMTMLLIRLLQLAIDNTIDGANITETMIQNSGTEIVLNVSMTSLLQIGVKPFIDKAKYFLRTKSVSVNSPPHLSSVLVTRVNILFAKTTITGLPIHSLFEYNIL